MGLVRVYEEGIHYQKVRTGIRVQIAWSGFGLGFPKMGSSPNTRR